MDSHDQNVFVMRSIEDCNRAPTGGVLVTSPKKILAQLARSGDLERGNVGTLSVQVVEKKPDRAVLPARVHSLQNNQKWILPGEIHQVCQLSEAVAEFGCPCHTFFLCHSPIRIGGDVSQNNIFFAGGCDREGHGRVLPLEGGHWM